MWNAKEHYRQYEVKDVNSAQEFIEKYYKHDRLRDIKHLLISSRIADLQTKGFTIISHHDNVTGKTVSYYGNP